MEYALGALVVVGLTNLFKHVYPTPLPASAKGGMAVLNSGIVALVLELGLFGMVAVYGLAQPVHVILRLVSAYGDLLRVRTMQESRLVRRRPT